MRGNADHYELVDLRLANQLAGLLWICGAIYVVALSAFDPGTYSAGPGGRATVATCVAVALVLGTLRLWRGSSSLSVLLVSAYLSCVLVAVVEVAATHTGAADLLFLIVGYCAFLHPPRRLLGILAAAALAALAPTLVGSASGAGAEAAGQVVLLSGMGALVFAASEGARGLRREVMRQRHQADALARVDALTGVGNRRACDEALLARVMDAVRTGRPLSLLVADLDHFKAINDRAGHGEGDRVLAEIAVCLREGVRLTDLCFRWGGDEFVVLLPDTGHGDASAIAERLREAVSSQVSGLHGEPVTLTAGVATLAPGETGQDLLARADAALVGRKAARSAPVALRT